MKNRKIYTTPPRLAVWILKQILPKEEFLYILGDFEEIYAGKAENKGKTNAAVWFWYQLIITVPGFLLNSFYWSIIMFQNYIKTAVRNIKKNKMHSFLNISGLSIAIACSLLIVLFIQDELSYDRFFPKAGRIYRITNERPNDVDYRHWAVTSPPLALELKKQIPEIEKAGRLFYLTNTVMKYNQVVGDPLQFEETGGFFADQEIIDIFDLNFIEGSPNGALTDLHTVVITSEIAEKYFSNEEAVGKTLTIAEDWELKVTGVMENLPENTHLNFDFLVSMESFYYMQKEAGPPMSEIVDNRDWAALYTYVLLNENQSRPAVEAKLPDFTFSYHEYIGTRERVLSQRRYLLQPITEIHLFSKLEQEMSPNSDIAYIYIFSALALFIMLIAAVNYVNISTAQALKRMKEVGVRKILGAKKPQLVKQFLGESYIQTFAAALTSLLIFFAAIPFYNNISGKDIEFGQVLIPEYFGIFLLISLIIGTVSGFYPAFVISSHKPVTSLKGIRDPRSNSNSIRKGLVIFQFFLSVFIIFCTLTIYKQMEFFRNKDLGFDKEQVVLVNMFAGMQVEILDNMDVFKSELLSHSGITNVTLASNIPGERLSVEPLIPEGAPRNIRLPQMRFLRTDKDYLNTLGLELIEGRNFSGIPTGGTNFILNEAAVKALELSQPIGHKAVTYFGTEGEIIGVIKDFHFVSLQNLIEPMVIQDFSHHENRNLGFGDIIIRISGGNIPEKIAYIEQTIKKLRPDILFKYQFLDENLNRHYEYESKISDAFNAFAIFALFISCLGLFGLTVYSAELRTKEIGIRKVLGASVFNITVNLTREFVFWVMIATAIAMPVGWFAMDYWLRNFAYRISVGIEIFFLSVLIALMIALLTVSYQGIKSGTSNPVKTLRYE